MGSITISANLDERDAQRLRSIAARENRSMSNALATAALVFASLPKEVRDVLIELATDPDEASKSALTKELRALVARHRFDQLSARIAAQGDFDGDPHATDLELLEEATALTKDV